TSQADPAAFHCLFNRDWVKTSYKNSIRHRDRRGDRHEARSRLFRKIAHAVLLCLRPNRIFISAYEGISDLPGFGRVRDWQCQEQGWPMRTRRPVCQRCQLEAKCSLPIVSGDPAIGERLKNFRASKGSRLVQCVDFLPQIEKHRQIKKCLFRTERDGRPSDHSLVLQLRHAEKKHVVYFPILEPYRTG